MVLSIHDAAGYAAASAVEKSDRARLTPARYFLMSVLGGAYIAVAVTLMISTSGPFYAIHSPITKPLQGAVFGVGLILVVFAGGELFTGTAMSMPQGLYARSIRAQDAFRVWWLCLLGNFIGSVTIAALVHGGGTFALGAKDGGPAPSEGVVTALIEAKNAASGSQLFCRAILCNFLVCLGLWTVSRTSSDMAKIALLWWTLLAFVACGFEHSVANMTTFSLGVFEGSAHWSDLGRNLLWTVPGNLVGGGIAVGVAYMWIAGTRTPTAAPTSPATPVGGFGS